MSQRIRVLLFETRAGDLLLRALERWLGLALVPIEEIDRECWSLAGRSAAND